MKESKMRILGVIFAAGRGSRLKPLTDEIPKPLAKIRNKSLLVRNLEKISPLVDSFVIVTNYLEEKIKKELGSEFENKKIEYVTQSSPKGGTMDAFRTAIYQSEVAKNNQDSNFLVINGDDLHGIEVYNEFENKIANNPEKAYFGAKIFTDKEKLKSFGVFEVNEKNEILEVVEKPENFISEMVNIGIYYFPKNIKNYIGENKLWEDEEDLITRDLINHYTKKESAELIISKGYWYSVSTIEDYDKLNSDLNIEL